MNKAMELLRRVFTTQQELEEKAASCAEIIIDPVTVVLTPQRPGMEQNVSTPIYSATLSKAMMDGANPDAMVNFENAPNPDDYGKVWIYNVSELSYSLSNGMLKNVKIPACEEGEEYAVATSLPMLFRAPKHHVDTNTTDCIVTDGRRVAQDLINPQNLGLDQDASTIAYTADGCNFNSRGVFWSTHNPPQKKELKAAHKRLKEYYQGIIEVAEIERITAAAKRLNIPAEVVRAADAYLA